MYGYTAALILNDSESVKDINTEIHKHDKSVISCFEKEYIMDGIDYMDVYIALE